jgi:hypothetical protein
MKQVAIWRWLVTALVGVSVPFLSVRADSRLVNLSNRVLVTPTQSVTAGLSIGGTTSETVLIRAIGPALSAYGISNPLAAPSLTIYNSSGAVVAGPIASWNSSDAATMASVGAFSLPTGSKDAAVVLSLQPGNYSAQVTTAGGGTGVALLEVYEVNATSTARLINLASRATVTSATNGSVVTGFVLGGSSNRTLLIRGVGPSLSSFGVSSPLANPALQLLDAQGRVIAENDDWSTAIAGGVSSSLLQAAFTQSGAFRLSDGSLDAAVLVTLAPGSYSVNVMSVAGSGGALAEVYDVTGAPVATSVAAATAFGSNTITDLPANQGPSSSSDPLPTGGSSAAGSNPGNGSTSIATRTANAITAGDYVDDTDLQLPKVGSNLLRILSPSLLELVAITTKQPDPAQVSSWNFANALPSASKFNVSINGQTVSVTAVGFKRRVLYAPLNSYDLRIQNSLYLTINASVSDSQLVTVTNPDATVWAASTQFQALSTPQRYSPAIHVNQEGYVPALAKQAQVGYYLGDMGEMPIPAGNGFKVVDAATGSTVFTGSLTVRPDSGYQTNPLPYQQVYVADFSAFKTPGQYQIEVPGMGASLPFLIDEGIAMAWTRTYSLGMYEQRSGMAVTMPFTRFTHAADHTAPALVPDSSSKFNFTWTTITGYATTTNSANPAQSAPFLTSNAAALYPYNRTGSVDVSGGHFDAGDYSKYTINSAQLTHELIFAADNIPGIKSFDNLGIPESGDGIPDALQEAKWEADYVAKLQDTDGGFYFLTYPINSEYESGVLPENGQQQVVWPKNTSASAASVAALAEAGSSPAMIKYYPAAAASYLVKAKAGWSFLMNAIAAHGKAGAYQKLTFYGDNWGHDDELAWAAASMFAATGDSQYQTQLFSWFPNPADSATFRWGWWQMSEGWGNAIRDYAFAARSGRLSKGALDASYLAACEGQVVAAGDNALGYTNASAYGTPFPPATKAVQGGGWYFSLDQASDMAIAYQVSPKPAYVDALVAAMNYEGGSNPVNTCFIEGLGMKRQQQTVSQYAQSSRRVLSPTGNVIGQVTAGFEYLNQYGSALSNLSYPSDSGSGAVFPYYDRWSDAYNVTTEQITVNDARSFISVGFLASLTASAATAWVAPQAAITVPTATVALGSPVTLTVSVAGQSLSGARIVWEGRDQLPAYGSTYTISPVNNGDQWVECEVEWPDGRRAFATGDFQANSASQVWIDDALPANANPNSGGGDSWNWTASGPTPKSGAVAFQTANKSGEHDLSFNGSTGSMDDDQSTIGQQGSLKVGAGDNLTAWVYLNPSSIPTEIMMCWYDGSSYEHRAYWGANQISWGSNNTPGCFNAGPLPSAGGWVKISVPASAVNLEGATVSGMTFAAYGGQLSWDAIGRN